MFNPSQGPSGIGSFPFSQGVRSPGGFPSNFPTPYHGGVPAPRGGGLSGLLQRFTQPSAVSQFPAAAGGGSKLTSTLGNVQQAIKMAQSAMPVIQQYGPMVKNIPMMINMLKAFNEEDSSDVDQETTESESVERVSSEEEVDKIEIEQENLYKIEAAEKPKKKTMRKVHTTQSGKSIPKLYI
ncbi:VrrA/YqfQ family protein [Sediminibacillus halophilus]|uniref:YqfQ-like protein n=1 Tax=Sediminibacillus halophilus TaxID=482461 RepID=A0A1G9M2U6_9BACI|nr:VrrA/YqfQ family protein [Sediminibacillus halophilus]SDL68589.1 YqfQ-like protein [Sediminibacillus halophilus]